MKYTLSQKKRNILEVAFLLEKSVYIIHHASLHGHDPGSHDPDPGPQENSMKKSCVSFESECNLLYLDVSGIWTQCHVLCTYAIKSQERGACSRV